MSITPVSSRPTRSADDADGVSAPSRVPTKSLDQEDFMKLLAVQFQMQDPMKPMGDAAFIAQSAQFAALEQASGMARAMADLRAEQRLTLANSYLGLNVTADTGNGGSVSGTVSSVQLSGGEPALVIDGRTVALSSVVAAERPTVPGIPLPVAPGRD